MNPDIIKVIPNDDYTLTLFFENNEVKKYDVKPFIEKGGVFTELIDITLFKTVKTWFGTVQWKNMQDICPDELYNNSCLSVSV